MEDKNPNNWNAFVAFENAQHHYALVAYQKYHPIIFYILKK